MLKVLLIEVDSDTTNLHDMHQIKIKITIFRAIYIKWGSEIRPFEIQTFWRSDFKWSGLSFGYSYNPNHSKTGPFEIRTFFLDFKCFLTKCRPFVWISNGWISGLQIPLKSRPFRFWIKLNLQFDLWDPIARIYVTDGRALSVKRLPLCRCITNGGFKQGL